MSKIYRFKNEAARLAFWGIPEPDSISVISYLTGWFYVCYFKIIVFLKLGNPHRCYFGE